MKLRTLLAAAALTLSTAAGHPAAAEDLTLEFTVWNYSLDTIEDNARKFEAENPGIKVNITDYTWQDYHDSMVLRFRDQRVDARTVWLVGRSPGRSAQQSKQFRFDA